MPILNRIHYPHTGKTGVVNWTGTAETYSRKIKNRESAVLVKMDENHLLLSVSKEDIDLLVEAEPFISTHTDTSIYIPRRLTFTEREEIINVLQILVDNGSIQDYGMNIRNVHTGTFLNFHHSQSKDCNLVRPFVEYLTRF